MNNHDLIARLERCGVVPVVEIADPSAAVALVDALAAGGLDVVEITLRTPAGLDAIRAIAAERPDVLVGAGTLLDPDALTAAVAAGAQFGVSPGHDPELVDAAAAAGLPYVPGVATASEIQRAVRGGTTMLKFFPAGVAGGPAALKALYGPFRPAGVRFMPTGGVTEANLPDYLAVPAVVAVGGTWLTPAADLAAGRWDAVSERAARARQAVDAVRVIA
jgi:2-dehydro-3-deoxyphosphogluconate aldolase/(4S)-4-hydroxy-2-oxoglutarate aldolase